MQLVLRRFNKTNIKKRLLKRFGISVGALILIVLIAWLIPNPQPKIRYSLRETVCPSATVLAQIAARHEKVSADPAACTIVITATSLSSKSAYVDYDGVGFGDNAPLIRIYTSNNKFCYAVPTGNDGSFTPYSTNEISLSCGSVSKPPKNYDSTSDAHPTSIVIAGSPVVTFKIHSLQ